MKKNLYIISLLVVIVAGSVNFAFGQFTLSAEVRPRAEFRNGFKKPLATSTDAAFFVEQRTRLISTYASENFDLTLSLQDIRTWGATAQVYKADPGLVNVYEAYAAYHFTPAHSLAVGRMALDYDNARMLGNLDWAQQGRSHDLVKYRFKNESVTFDLGAAFNQDASTPEFGKLTSTFYSGVSNYKTMQYAWLHKNTAKGGISLLLMNNGMQAADSTVNFSQTAGLYGTRTLGSAGLEIEAYYQAGKNAAGADLGAYLLSANITLWKSNPHNLSIGFDYLSGDNSSTADKDEAFNPFYGTNHKFYGFMDYFYVGNGHMNKGLIDLYMKAKIKTGEKSALLVQAHDFLAQTEVGTKSDGTEYSTMLSNEVDLVYNLSLKGGVTFNVGYSQMITTESIEFIKGVASAKAAPSWGWAMISFKPTLFTTKTN